MKHNQILTILLFALCTGLLCLALSTGPSTAKTSQRQSNLVARDSGRSVFSQSSTAQNRTRSNAERENQNGLQKTNLTQTPAVAPSKGKLSLFVRDVITGYGVKSEILFSSSTDSHLLSTDDGGILEFVADGGRFDLTINAPGYKQVKTFFSVTSNEEVKTNIWLDRESNQDVTEPINESAAVIEGYVVDGATGKPIEGVNVYFTALDKHIKTNKNGYFKSEPEPVSHLEGNQGDNQRRVRIEFTKESFRDYVIENFLLVPGVVTLRITLEKGQDKVIENYFQSILDKHNENTDIYEQPPPINQGQNFDGNKGKSDVSSLQSCPTLPTTIRVGTGCPTSGGSPVCNQVCTGTVQVMSLESYVQSGLDNEWIPSWMPASLQAGAVAYRTYGAYYVINQPLQNPNYDIRSDTCNQAWVSGTSTSCVNAANATVGEVIVNSSNVIVKAEYSAENNNAGCGNGFSGTGSAWPCISDSVCSGFSNNGHGRGMCQYGSSRWAAQGQTYTWILDHYYNPGNYFRCGSVGVTPPANDNCSNATVLTSSTSCNYTSGTVLNATASGLAKPSCDSSSSPNMRDVWYRFTATSSSQTVTVDPSTAVGDPVVSVYSSCSGSPIGCSDLGAGVIENLSLSGLTVGNTYYVRIYDFGSVEPTGSDANFQVCVTGTPTSGSPDLTITAGTQNVTPTTVVAGSNVTASCSEDNSGNATAGANVVSLYLSTDAVLTPGSNGDTYLGFIQFSSVAANSNSPVNSKSIQIPSGTAPGTYYVFFWADGEQVVNESTENNNFATRQLTITPAAQNYTITVSASPSGGGTVSGGGTFAAGSSRTVTATANTGYSFTNWTESGSVVSSSASYNFTLNSNRNLVANFTTSSVQFSSATYSVNEDGGSKTIIVTRTGGTNAFVVNYATSNGTATAGADYTAVNGVLSFATNETSKNFTVPIINDTSVEGNETLNLTLSNPSGGVTLGSPSTAVLTIVDNDTACTYSISSSEITLSPNLTSVNFNMDAPSGCAWTAVSDSPSWLTTSSSGSGDGTISYQAAANPSSSSRVGHINVGGQVHTVTQIGVGGAGNVRFSSVTYTANEGGGDATITVTRAGGTGDGNVQYSTSNGTATAGTDYVSASGTLFFVGNETSKTFNVTILDDATFEGDESFNLSLKNNSSSFTLGNPSTATLTIIDNDSPPDSTGPSLSINSHGNGDTVSNSSITLSGTASDSGRGNNGISSVTVNGVGASGGTASGSGTANWSRTLTLSQGANNITVVARDNSSNQNSTTQSITLNYQPTQTYSIAVSASPSGGGTVSGGGTFAAGSSRTVTASANSNYTFANWTENGSVVSSSASYTFTLNGNRTLVANFSIVSSGNAAYDSTLKAPKCPVPGSVCDSGTLINGRGNITGGAEPNQPNTIYNSCVDNSVGSYHVDESIDNIRVSTLDGSSFAPGKTVKIEVTVWAFSTDDFLDLFFAADAANPNWDYITSLSPSVTGAQVLSTTFTLPPGGSLQAVRANFLYQGELSICSSGSDSYEDHDDLVFAVGSGATQSIQLLLEEVGPSPSQAAAVDAMFLLRDPFLVVNEANLFNLGLDRNTRVIIFVTNLQLTQGEPSSSVVVNLIDSSGHSYDIAAEDVHPVPNFNFTQVIFRLPDNLPVGTCTIKVLAHGQVSNTGTIRIRI